MKIRNRTVNRLLAKLGAVLVVCWMRTCRVTIAFEPGTSPFADATRTAGAARYFYPFWHEWIVAYVFCKKLHRMGGLISAHRDGGYLADAVGVIGARIVRGSSSRGGAGAVREILDNWDGWHVAVTPDGPRGPRRAAKSGVIFLAGRTGRPLVVTGAAFSAAWRPKGSWTDMVLPKPFSRVVIAGSPAQTYPPDMTKAQIAAEAAHVSGEIDRLEAAAEAVLRGEPHDPRAGWRSWGERTAGTAGGEEVRRAA